MALVIGWATKDEIKTLKKRGWKIEKPPKEIDPTGTPDPDLKYIMVFVDNDIFSIMNGPDWDKGEGK